MPHEDQRIYATTRSSRPRWRGCARESGRAASAAALAGLVLTVDGAVPAGRLIGNVLALVMTVLISAMMVIIRSHRETPMQ